MNRGGKGLFGEDVLLSCLLASTLIMVYNKIFALGENFDTFETISFTKKEPDIKFGFDLNEVEFETKRVEKGENLSSILSTYGVEEEKIKTLEEKTKKVSSTFTRLKTNSKLFIVKNDKCTSPACVVYEPSPFEYIVYDLKDEVNFKLSKKETQTCTEISAGRIKKSLIHSLNERKIDTKIVNRLEEALSSTVDFYHTDAGDEFKFIYERKYIEDRDMGIGKLLGAYYKNDEGEFYSIYFDNGKTKGFFDLDGRPVKTGFLKAPVRNVRISSGYNMKRMHPVLGYVRPHFGTDYAAPYGTPIIAVADGVVAEAGYSGGNGRYVKLKHDKTYQTQYLHMQSFGKGIKRGQRVRQGQTIGYVGATGLATGPHVCFRFWKNGQQINHLRHKMSPQQPMPKRDMPEFLAVKAKVLDMFDGIEAVPAEYAAKEKVKKKKNA
jgi:murein DD-endopeptidase MepM/ murein hydrolase activator NlpD